MDDEKEVQEPQDSPDPAVDDGATENEPVEDLSEFRIRAEKAEGYIRDLKDTFGVKSVKELKNLLKEKTEPKGEPKPQQETSQEVSDREFMELRLAGYSPEEISVVQKLADGESLTEAAKNQTVQTVINGLRSARKKEEKIPEPSSRVPVFGDKSFSELPKEEKNKNYAKVVDELVKKARKTPRNLT